MQNFPGHLHLNYDSGPTSPPIFVPCNIPLSSNKEKPLSAFLSCNVFLQVEIGLAPWGYLALHPCTTVAMLC